jgi:hypothetical protein
MDQLHKKPPAFFFVLYQRNPKGATEKKRPVKRQGKRELTEGREIW